MNNSNPNTKGEREMKNTARVWTAGRNGSKMANVGNGITVPIWTGKIYEARVNKKDGVCTWRLVESFGGTRATKGNPSSKFIGELSECEAAAGLPYLPHVTHGTPVCPFVG